MNVRLFRPSLGEEELELIREAFERSWVGLGPAVTRFENDWKIFTGSRMAVAVNSATAALHLALALFRFSKGKKVLVPSLTFASTATAILYNDLVPVFVDSDPVTLGMSLEDKEKKYDSDCVAVMPVHYAGHPVEMDKLVEWARDKDMKVIEDCAHTAGGYYKGKLLGRWGDMGCYSFEEKKLMTTGDGGMLVSDNPDYEQAARAMRWVGIDKDNWKSAQKYVSADQNAMHWYYEISLLGYKYNMNDLAASLGIAQLSKLPQMNSRRSEIIGQYMEQLRGIDEIEMLVPFAPDLYPYQMFGIRCNDRAKLMVYLKGKGMSTGCHYTPLTLQPLFSRYRSECPYIEQEWTRLVTLPLHAGLTDDEVRWVTSHIRGFYKG